MKTGGPTRVSAGVMLWAVFLLICYLPPCAVVVLGALGSPAAKDLSLPGPRRLQLLLYSAALALAVAGLAMLLAAPLAAALWRASRGLARATLWILLGWIVVPPCVTAMAWLGLWNGAQAFLTSWGFGGMPLTGWVAAALLQTVSFLPLAVALAWLGFESIDTELLQAARMQRPEKAVFLCIALPLAAPALVAGGGLIGLLSLLDFSLPSLCGVTVYTLDLFAEYSADGNARAALFGALPLAAACAVALWLSQAIFRNAVSVARRHDRAARVPVRGLFARVLCVFCWTGLAFLLLVPVLALVWMAASGTGVGAAWAAVREEMFGSLRIALAAALLGLLPALAVAETLAEGGWRSHAAWPLVTLPLAIPPTLVGIGWAALSARTGWLQGSGWLPVLAALTRFLPVAALILLVARRRMDPLLWDAARVFQANPWHGFRRVRLPLLGRGILAAATLTVALTLGELGATLVVIPPGESTLTLRLYQFLHYGASAHVAALGLLLATLAALAGVAVGRLLTGAEGNVRTAGALATERTEDGAGRDAPSRSP